eukprot:CAMPEP_0179100898 /NCGR_PEP_ID=MMETSP0796-20121207/46622_1 /TAXON_ID=73915 /ORGANISM="Pyrodinium bahamense, Strain pbaha01" /LENGTH=446 /DNA_ID=CAMNT_0020798733 /DNA_START=84 /DNA_END=1424 /DNA_ORIENTATION=-
MTCQSRASSSEGRRRRVTPAVAAAKRMHFRPFVPFKGAAFGKGGKGFEEEDRSRDWYCNKCRERNFVKRAECFKCKAPKPKDIDCSAPPRPVIPQSGTTLNGMVKSYNRKGFGFLMCFGIEHCQDIHYTRENLSPKLQTRDIPGQHVTFEIHRSPDGKLTALNIRPIGEEPESISACGKGCGGKVGGKGLGFTGKAAGREEEEGAVTGSVPPAGSGTSSSASSASGARRCACRKWQPGPQASVSRRARRPPSRGALSRPMLAHALGVRFTQRVPAAAAAARGAVAEEEEEEEAEPLGQQQGLLEQQLEGQEEEEVVQAQAAPVAKPQQLPEGPSASSGSESSDCKMEDPSGTAGSRGHSGGQADASDTAAVAALKSQCNGSPDVEKAKAEALEELMKLRSLDTKEARMTEFRALLRKWHPDKNPERVEVATAVFQFLQKGKPVLDA